MRSRIPTSWAFPVSAIKMLFNEEHMPGAYCKKTVKITRSLCGPCLYKLKLDHSLRHCRWCKGRIEYGQEFITFYHFPSDNCTAYMHIGCASIMKSELSVLLDAEGRK